MAKPYQMLDLGYPRTPTSATLRVTMPDGTVWDVPLQVVVDHCDRKYHTYRMDRIGEIRQLKVFPGWLVAYAENVMAWAELEPFATRISEPGPPDYERGWRHGNKREIVGEV